MKPNDDEESDLASKLAALPRAIEPGRDLWGGVGQRIEAERRRATLARRRTATGVGALVLAAAAATLLLVRHGQQPQATREPVPPVVSAPAPVMTPTAPSLPEEASYLTALSALTPVFEERKKALPAEGVEALGKSLSALDSAIAATRASLAVAPEDDHLRTELDSEYEQKIDMMNDVLEWDDEVLTMRPLVFTFAFTLLSLTGLACAPHVASAEPVKAPHATHTGDECDAPAPPGIGSSSIDVSVPVKANTFVDVHEFAGSVHVAGWTQAAVHVKGKFSSDCHVDVSPSGDREEVRLTCNHGPGSGDLEIQVPQASGLEIRTMSANIAVQDVSGGLRLHTVVGDVEVKGGAPSEVEVRSTSGDVKIDASSPAVHVETVSGDVHVTGVRGRARIRTVTEDSVLSGGEFNEITFESVSGGLGFTGSLIGQGAFELQSHSGDLVLHLPAVTNADVEMHTFSGDLMVDLGATHKEGSRDLEARLGSGGARLHLRTFSGDAKVAR